MAIIKLSFDLGNVLIRINYLYRLSCFWEVEVTQEDERHTEKNRDLKIYIIIYSRVLFLFIETDLI